MRAFSCSFPTNQSFRRQRYAPPLHSAHDFAFSLLPCHFSRNSILRPPYCHQRPVSCTGVFDTHLHVTPYPFSLLTSHWPTPVRAFRKQNTSQLDLGKVTWDATDMSSAPTSNGHICSLPRELLVDIFRRVTDNPVRDIDSVVSWKPFEGSYVSEELEACKDALRTKYALTVTCRLFRDLMPEFLYEDVWIRYGSDGLREVLEKSKNEEIDISGGGLGYGRFVRRISLASAGPVESHSSILKNAHAILSCCLNVQAIVRPSQGQLPEGVGFIENNPPIDDLHLPRLHRVEWHNVANDALLATAPTPSPFLFSESIRVLILGSGNFPDSHNVPELIVSLPNVHTLCIQSIDAFGEPSRDLRRTISLPSLRHIILRRPEAMHNFFDGGLTPLCSQLTSLELSADFRFLRHDFISQLLTFCPNISDLYIPVFTTRAVHPNAIPRAFLEFPSVRRVYLNAKLPSGYVYGQEAWWMMLEAHFGGIWGVNSRFVGVERVVLSGREWMGCVRDGEGRFRNLLGMVGRRNRDGVGAEIGIGADDEGVRRELDVAFEEVTRNLLE